MQWVEEKSSSGKKVELSKKLNFFPLELFSSKSFLVHMEAKMLQEWQTTCFKAWPNDEELARVCGVPAVLVRASSFGR